MRAAIVHAVLLVAVLLLAFQTWTRDEPAGIGREEVAVWRESPERVASVSYERENESLVIERRRTDGESYLWGIVRRMPADSALSPGEPTIEEFPVGDRGEDLLDRLAALGALRDLGPLSDSLKLRYELADPERKLSVAMGDRTRQLRIGGSVFGGGHRYAVEPETGRGYVISSDILRQLERGQGVLHLTKLHEFEPRDVARVVVRAGAGVRTMRREMQEDAASLTGAVWRDLDSGEPDQTFANFMDRIQRLAVATYPAALDSASLELRVRVEYLDTHARLLGFLELFRRPTDREGFEYYLKTELTRVHARTHPAVGERVDEDLREIV
jgi:hypothetical protein